MVRPYQSKYATLPRPTTSSNTGANLYRRVHICWTAVTVSLIADPLLFERQVGALSPQQAICIIALLTTLLLPFLSHRRVHSVLRSLRRTQKEALLEEKRWIAFVGIFGGVVAALSKIFFFTNLPILPAILLVFAVVVALMRSSRRALKNIEEERKRFIKDPFALLRRWEDQVVVFSMLPMVIARLIGLVGTLQIFALESSFLQSSPYTLLSFLLLAMLRPQRHTFSGFCEKCKLPVPLVMVSFGSCYRCDADSFTVHEKREEILQKAQKRTT